MLQKYFDLKKVNLILSKHPLGLSFPVSAGHLPVFGLVLHSTKLVQLLLIMNCLWNGHQTLI